MSSDADTTTSSAGRAREPLRRVLYVDDEPDIRQIVAMALSLAPGLAIRTADSGSAALELAREMQPDLILLDVMMPGLDGPATLARLRSDPLLAPIPVVFVTARAMSQEIERLMAAGAAGVIAKPFDPMTLATQVLALWDRLPAQDASSDARIRAARPAEPVPELQLVARRFLERTHRQLADLLGLIAAVRQGSASAAAELWRLAHSMRGTGSTLGLTEISTHAADIESRAARLAERSAASGALVASASDCQQLLEDAQRLARAVDAALARDRPA